VRANHLKRYPAPSRLAEIGTEWIKKNESLLLRVPSAVVEQEYNILINPLHPAMKQFTIIQATPWHSTNAICADYLQGKKGSNDDRKKGNEILDAQAFYLGFGFFPFILRRNPRAYAKQTAIAR
jgi:hypothetical protein